MEELTENLNQSRELSENIDWLLNTMCLMAEMGEDQVVPDVDKERRLDQLLEEGRTVDSRSSALNYLSSFRATDVRIAQLGVLVGRIAELLQTDGFITTREVYYENVSVFQSQRVVCSLVDRLCNWFDCVREDLHLMASAKGLVAGPLSFIAAAGHGRTQCQLKTATLIPPRADLVEDVRIEPTVKLIVVVEKDSIFQLLLDEGFTSDGRVVIVTGKGMPDFATRLFLRRIVDSCQNRLMPVFGSLLKLEESFVLSR